MHKLSMPQWAIDRVMERRGRLHSYADLDPRTTALIVVDLQNGFMLEDVAVAYVPGAVEIVPNVNRLAAAVRRTGGKVFWIKNTIDDANMESWSHWFEAATPETRRKRILNMAPGTRGHELHHGLEVEPEDAIVPKYRFSAFIQGASDLPQQLRALGCDTVLITGTVTNVCCESTARDAMMLDYRVVMLSDANATWTDEEHAATLNSFMLFFGDVMTADDAIGRLTPVESRKSA